MRQMVLVLQLNYNLLKNAVTDIYFLRLTRKVR
ncbi:Uncharacterised protein [Sphingobacterium thalpophilum]|uniref:Uncharacterized protein n=1 Tax=Sphingobacterium thalpophilum TaxID=259 RepID=A0A4V6KSX2_9SPHI|nr:Uncharacterised protein [Sphingobacterium thalpophilum]